MWKWDFCIFLLGASSGFEVHRIVIEVGEYQCGWGLHDTRKYVGGDGVHSGSLLIVLLSLVHFLFMLLTCFQAHICACLAPNMENWTPAVASLQHAASWMTDHQVFQNVSWKAQRSCQFNYDSSITVPVLLGRLSCDQECREYGLCWSFYFFQGFCKEISHVLWKLQQARRMETPKYFLDLFSFLASLLTFKQAFLCFARGFGALGPRASQQLAKVQANLGRIICDIQVKCGEVKSSRWVSIHMHVCILSVYCSSATRAFWVAGALCHWVCTGDTLVEACGFCLE